jgi:hypothetical protein
LTVTSQASCFERVWQSDSAIQKDIIQELCEQIDHTFLSDESTRQFNVRKTDLVANNSILDLIHPYDFPLIPDRTLQLKKDGTGTLIGRVSPIDRIFSAIPTDFYIPEDRLQLAMRLGYINNLPPTRAFAHLTSLITQVVGHVVPLFEQLLMSLHRANHILLEPRIPLLKHPFRYEKGEDPPNEPGQGIGEGTDDEEDTAMWLTWADEHRRWVQTRIAILPDVPHDRYFDSGKFNIPEENKVTLRGRKIQVSVQLDRVELVGNMNQP